MKREQVDVVLGDYVLVLGLDGWSCICGVLAKEERTAVLGKEGQSTQLAVDRARGENKKKERGSM